MDEEDQKIYTAALNQIQFDPYTVDGIASKNPICEKKALVKGPQGEIIVRFVDRCPQCLEGNVFSHFELQLLTNLSCTSGDIALTEEAFLAVNGELGTGRTNVEWKFI